MTLLEKMARRLRGQSAWITGAKRIGQRVAMALAEQGVHLVLSYRRSKTEAERTARRARLLGVRAQTVRADAGSRSDMARALKEASPKFPRFQILVNLASVFGPVPFAKVSQEDWDCNIAAHLLGTFWPIQLISPRMPRGSHIVNVADRTTIGRVYRNYVPYTVTKHAVEGITRAAAVELAGRGIFVNAIAPGPILKPPWEPQAAWNALRRSSRIRAPVSDDEAMDQFALLVIYLCWTTMSSGYTYPLDQGQNL